MLCAESRPRRHAAPAIVVLVCAVLLGACANVPTTAGPAADPRAVDPRAADIAFAHAMIPHHEQALELTALVPGRAVSPVVADIAFRVDRHQAKEIGQLQGVLRAWGESPTDHGAHADHGGAGMLAPGDIDRLRTLEGREFDEAWSAAMISHHEGAVAMARGLMVSTGQRATLTEMARTMIAVQENEIGALRGELA